MTRYTHQIALIILSAIMQFSMAVPAIAMSEGKITLQVIDEKRNPMPGIEVVIGFDGIGVKAFRGHTDVSGSFTASYSTAGGVSYAAKKDGYYESQGRINLQRIEGDRWFPWNEKVQLMLRKIEKPVPMFARNTKLSGLVIPVANKEVGFDLAEYSWVSPYGTGKHGDIIFKLERKYNNADDYDCRLIITFSDEYDGILLVKEDRSKGSLLKLPRYAPEEGYQQPLTKTRRKNPGGALQRDYQEDNNYIFRVRSEVVNKKLKRAMYGKIQGDITFDPRDSDTASIIFTYYLNPDYTRNLEFDQHKNLFNNMRSIEAVGL